MEQKNLKSMIKQENIPEKKIKNKAENKQNLNQKLDDAFDMLPSSSDSNEGSDEFY